MLKKLLLAGTVSAISFCSFAGHHKTDIHFYLLSAGKTSPYSLNTGNSGWDIVKLHIRQTCGGVYDYTHNDGYIDPVPTGKSTVTMTIAECKKDNMGIRRGYVGSEIFFVLRGSDQEISAGTFKNWNEVNLMRDGTRISVVTIESK
ncbi:hypothetical protein [Dongshaea marina]|uniref:hypothetical protein n=1 Tax=Dongshaea marina TaxID=2047966 RepID=UPI000D3E9AD8|nr:hypothetical protein [Dongshaea marina]